MHMSTRYRAARTRAFFGAKAGRASRHALTSTLALFGGVVVALAVLPSAVTPAAVSAAEATSDSGSWTVYHGDSEETGVDTSGATFPSVVRAWASPQLDGQLYGEPLELDGMVYAATENDTVYALSASSGQVVWSTHVGTPVASNTLPCGDISPNMGITGTPVIDAARHEIFAVADESVSGVPSHHLIGLDTETGTVELDQDVDPPGADTAAILQRTGLNLSDGSVVFGYGGNAGDCSTYHGWVVGVPETGGTANFFDVTSGPKGGRGAVWMGGAAPVVDQSGNVWVSTGNGDAGPGDPFDGGNSVVELSSQLSLKQIFAPSDWAMQNSIDQDLGSSPPALLSNGTVLQAGKAHTAYELNQAALDGIGGQVASASVCPNSNVDGGEVIERSVVYIPCQGGIEAVNVSSSPPGLNVLWTNKSATTPPILAGGLLWAFGPPGGGSLFAIDPATGRTVQQLSVGANANHFPTPSVGAGMLLITTASQVLAYTASPGPPPDRSYWLASSDGGIFTFGSAPFDGSLGSLRLNAPVVGMAPTPDGKGYWLVAADGGIFTFGDAGFFGSRGGMELNAPVVGMAATPDGKGYWLVAADGGIFTFGDAGFFGSRGGMELNAPVVGMAATPDGKGYWLVAADGGIFTFGDARFSGSKGGTELNAPIVGMAPTPDGKGYWLVAADGGIFTLGDAGFFGSMGGTALNAPVVGMARTPDGDGYWLVAADGDVFNFGDALFNGSMGIFPLNQPIVALADAG